MSENDSKLNALKSIGANLNNLRQSNPQVFFGAIGAAVLIVFLFLLTGGGTEQSPRLQALLTVGETYTLVNPNGGATLLVAVPGRFSSADYDVTGSQNICTLTPGTRATLLEQTLLNYIHFVKVEPSEGPCKGKSGWTSKVNIKI